MVQRNYFPDCFLSENAEDEVETPKRNAGNNAVKAVEARKEMGSGSRSRVEVESKKRRRPCHCGQDHSALCHFCDSGLCEKHVVMEGRARCGHEHCDPHDKNHDVAPEAPPSATRTHLQRKQKGVSSDKGGDLTKHRPQRAVRMLPADEVDADLGGGTDGGSEGRGQRNLAADVEPAAEVLVGSSRGKPSQPRPGALQGDTMPPPVGEEVKHEGGLPEHQPAGVELEGGSGSGGGVGLRTLGDVHDAPGDPAASASTPAYGEAEKLQREADQEKQEVEKQMAEASDTMEKLQRKLDENQKKAARAHKLANCEAAAKEAVDDRVRVSAAAAVARDTARDALDVANKVVIDYPKTKRDVAAKRLVEENNMKARWTTEDNNMKACWTTEDKEMEETNRGQLVAQKQAIANERAALEAFHKIDAAATKAVNEKQREWDDARRA